MTETLDEMLARQDAEFVRGLRAKTPRGLNVPKPKPKRKTPEMDAQESVVEWLRDAGCITSRNINEVQSREKDRLKRWLFWKKLVRTGCTSAFPDITAILPTGGTVYIEMKAGKNGLSDEQERLHADLKLRGAVVVMGTCIWSVETALRAQGISLARTTLRRAVPVAPL